MAVPTFRALKNLEQQQPTSASVVASAAGPTGWSTSRGIMFSFGLLVTLAATLSVCYHLFFYVIVFRDGGDAVKQFHVERLVGDVDHFTPVDALVDFQNMANKGLTVDGVPPWSMVSEMRDISRHWLTLSLVALAVGIVSLTASLLGSAAPA